MGKEVWNLLDLSELGKSWIYEVIACTYMVLECWKKLVSRTQYVISRDDSVVSSFSNPQSDRKHLGVLTKMEVGWISPRNIDQLISSILQVSGTITVIYAAGLVLAVLGRLAKCFLVKRLINNQSFDGALFFRILSRCTTYISFTSLVLRTSKFSTWLT